MAGNIEKANLLQQADVRLCRLCLWTNFEGLGIYLKHSSYPPCLLRAIDSNSPAAASGLRIWDVILAVNQQDMSNKNYNRVGEAIRVARDVNTYVELLVVEEKFYEVLKQQKIPIDSTIATIISTPTTMPADFANFPKLIPRICDLRLGRNDTIFGFTVVNGENDIGAYIQTISPDSPATDAALRKSDRIIEINNRNVDKNSTEYIIKKLDKASRKGKIKLLVADTQTYEHYHKNNMKFSSTDLNKAIHSTPSQSVGSSKTNRKSMTKEDDDRHQISDNEASSNYGMIRSNFSSFSGNTLSNNKRQNDAKTKLDDEGYPLNGVFHRWNEGSYGRRCSQIFSSFKKSTVKHDRVDQAVGNDRSVSDDESYDDNKSDDYHSNKDRITSDIKPPVGRTYSLTDLRKLSQSIYSKPPITNNGANVANGRIEICHGDITEQVVDAIVVASTSDRLKENVLRQAGDSIRTVYNREKQQKINKSICTNGGNLACKRIYFIPCPQMSRNTDKWTFRHFVSEAIKIATNDHSSTIQSVAFPAIGCGQYGCDANFVAKTLIMAVAYELEHQPLLQLNVYFVIQSRQQKIFDTFRNEIIVLKNNGSTSRTSQSSKTIRHLPPKVPTYERMANGFVVEKRLLKKSSAIYTRVINEFSSTMTSQLYREIVRVELIWNERWYKQYMIHQADFFQRLQNDTEKHLFHGCSERAANSIIKECFNRSYAGLHGTVYGHGVYFSSKASYSHSYATANTNGERCMFLAKVLIGKTILGNSSMKVCPLGYDTTTDGSHIYVIYHDAQAFGHYLITYR